MDAAIFTLTVGITAFVFCLDPRGGDPLAAPMLAWLLALAASGTVVAVAVVLGRARLRNHRAALLGIATGTLFGVNAALTSAVGAAYRGGLPGVFTTWHTYLLLVLGPAAFYLLQNALHAGSLIASQPGFTLTNPVESVGRGLLVFDEQVRGGWWTIGAVTGAALITLGMTPVLTLLLTLGDTRPMRGQRVVYGRPSVEKTLGALPVVADCCRGLDLAGIIDRACPIREDVAILTHGQVIEALVANRLTSPAPLVRVAEWARAWAVDEAFGIDASALNDDRIARALDAIAPELGRIVGSVGAQAIAAFGLDVSRLHWDMTSISLYGAYGQIDDRFAAPKFGHPKDRRPDLRQVQAGLAVTGDGGVPILHRAYDGGAGELAQVVGAMTALKTIAGPRRFLLVADSKLVSYGNIRDMIAANVEFIAPASKTYVPAAVLAALDLDAASTVDYVAERDARTPAGQRGRWRVVEDAMSIAGAPQERPGARPAAGVRALHRSRPRRRGSAGQETRSCPRRPGPVDTRTGSRHYPTAQTVTERVSAISRSRRVGAYLHTEVGTDPTTAKPTLRWWFDQTAVDAEAATDGWYALLTNLPATITAAEILVRYKGQEVAQRRYSAFKGPLAVAPMFLEDQPPHPRLDHRDLPRPADLLPHRTRRPRRDRPPDNDDRPVSRPESQTHRPVDLPSPDRTTTNPRPRRPASAHPTTQPRPSPAPRPTCR